MLRTQRLWKLLNGNIYQINLISTTKYLRVVARFEQRASLENFNRVLDLIVWVTLALKSRLEVRNSV
jgi:hypothetical protein